MSFYKYLEKHGRLPSWKPFDRKKPTAPLSDQYCKVNTPKYIPVHPTIAKDVILLGPDVGPDVYVPVRVDSRGRLDPPSEEEKRVELEDKWQEQPARLLRLMYRDRHRSRFIEDSADDDAAVARLVKKFDVRTMFSQPVWVKQQMHVFLTLLNTLHEFRTYEVNQDSAFVRGPEEVRCEELAQLRDDMKTLVDKGHSPETSSSSATSRFQ